MSAHALRRRTRRPHRRRTRPLSSLIQSWGPGNLYRIGLVAQRDGLDYNPAHIGANSGAAAAWIPVTLRYFDPSDPIRSVPADAEDSILRDFFARNAAHAAMAGKTGPAIGLLRDTFIHASIGLLAGQKNSLDLNGVIWRAALAAAGQPSGEPA